MKNRWDWKVLDADESKSYSDSVLAEGRFDEGELGEAQDLLKQILSDDFNLDGDWIEVEYCGATSLAFEMKQTDFIVELSTVHYNYAPHPSLKYHH